MVWTPEADTDRLVRLHAQEYPGCKQAFVLWLCFANVNVIS